ncbi:MAG: glycoside hydrolase family 9 protein [Reichenbachiella sp.]
MMKIIATLLLTYLTLSLFAQKNLEINDEGYFQMDGLDVTVFSDIYPDGHQTGVTIIQHGVRVAANGDLRLEASPGQWSPVPKGGKLIIDAPSKSIDQKLWYPDSSKNRKGFNPIIYPDLTFSYHVKVTALKGSAFKITVNLDEPLPEEWIGKVGFNFELFPGDLFGSSYLMDDEMGIFPTQPNGPLFELNNRILARPFATGNQLIIAPESDLQRIKIESNSIPLSVIDGRTNHNNGWFIVRSLIPSGATNKAIEWTITPNVIEGWKYNPVVQVSQLGYHPNQKKTAIVELDGRQDEFENFTIYKLTAEGKKEVKQGETKSWGKFLRYNYATFDFSEIKQPGMYQASYGGTISNPFQISEDVYDRNVWQPTLEYYLPVQMCHMRVNEKYRVWHDRCHLDDALMAPTDLNHFDGYKQGSSTLTSFESGQAISGLNKGGWHDAGDYDLRVESQIGTTWMLALMVEEFGLDYDATFIDNENKIVEIHQPDGKSDALQQIEHGLETVLGGYRSLGRLYRGIICPTLRQYVMLGDAVSMTDNLIFDPKLDSGDFMANSSGIADDRWVFTEENPNRELYVVAGLAAASRVLKTSNPELSSEALEVAETIWNQSSETKNAIRNKILALSELILATNNPTYTKSFIALQNEIVENISKTGWAVGHVIHKIENKKFRKAVAQAVSQYQAELVVAQNEDSPYGVPYKPNIWGAGWSIQRFGVEQYFFNKGWPELTSTSFYENALHFILGVHPGTNTASFASGVGSKSITVAYGVNRADWSFIPGGSVSGTALIRPNLPELKEWPFFWQQTEYVMGGGATNYMFLALAVQQLYKDE